MTSFPEPTDRLMFRHWDIRDASEKLILTSDPDIGPRSGWRGEATLEEAEYSIEHYLNGLYDFAIIYKQTAKLIGAISIKTDKSSYRQSDDECELGFWIGRDYWGQGLMPEAARSVIAFAFEELHMSKIWCAHYDFNIQSQRVQEKLGFEYQFTKENVFVETLGEERTSIVRVLTRERYEELYRS